MKETDLIIPERDGSLLCTPPINEIFNAVRTNRKLFATWSFSIGNIPVETFRKDVRETGLSLSELYTDNLTSDATLKSSNKIMEKDDIIFQTGHQPGFVHTGIIVKYLLLNLLTVRHNSIGIDLVVDSNTTSEISVETPNLNNNAFTEKIPLITLTKPTLIESLPSPTSRELKIFLNRIAAVLEYPAGKHLRKNFEQWSKFLNTMPINRLNMTDFLISARRIFESEKTNPPSYNELPLSRQSGSEPFYNFFLHILFKAREFAVIYNNHLNSYRKKHKLRYKANPFPDLLIDNETVELPFWNIRQNKRERLTIKTVKNKIFLLSANEPMIEFAEKELLRQSQKLKDCGLNIRPKAIMLTIFQRMFFADIFIHGMGGAKYDRITDAIIKDFFKVKPPGYVAITLTQYPNVSVTDKSKLIHKLEHRLREIKYNPDKYFDRDIEKTNIPMIEEKKLLLREIRKNGVDKKRISKEIKNINGKLITLISPKINRIEKELKMFGDEQNIWNIVRKREYPYFLFSREDLTKNILF